MTNSSGFGRVTRDVIDLVELQMQLLSVDGQVAKRKAIRAVVCGVVAATLGGSALTTAMLGGGFMLHEKLQWTVGDSLLTIAGGTLLIVGLLVIIAMLAIKSAGAAMSETKSEFAENLKWVKAVLVSPSSSPRNKIRTEDFPSPQESASSPHQNSLYSTHSRFNGR